MAGPLVTLTGPTPFEDCDIASEDCENFMNAEVETWVDVNPAYTENLVAGWQQDCRSNGGSRRLLSAYSTNGGGINAILVSKSTDCGKTSGKPKVLIRDADGRAFYGKNAMTAAPNDSTFVDVVWDRLFATTLPATKKIHGDAATGARARRLALLERKTADGRPSGWYVGPSCIARTVDGGGTWETAKKIFNPGINAQTIGNQVVVLNNGTVLNFYTEITATGRTFLGFQKSNGHGANFAPARRAITTNITLNGTSTPNSSKPVRDGNILFDVAIGRDSGNLYLVWRDGRELGVDRVAFSASPPPSPTTPARW